MYTFYIYNLQTGEYVGKRITSNRYPVFPPITEEAIPVIGIYSESLPLNLKSQIRAHPEYFKYINEEFVELSQAEKDTIITNRTVEIN